jgi:hypothetical protein
MVADGEELVIWVCDPHPLSIYIGQSALSVLSYRGSVEA